MSVREIINTVHRLKKKILWPVGQTGWWWFAASRPVCSPTCCLILTGFRWITVHRTGRNVHLFHAYVLSARQSSHFQSHKDHTMLTIITRRVRFVLLSVSFIPSHLIQLVLSCPFPQGPSPAVNMSAQHRISSCSGAAYPSRCQQCDSFLRQKTAAVVSVIADKRSASVRRDRAVQLGSTRFVLLHCWVYLTKPWRARPHII